MTQQHDLLVTYARRRQQKNATRIGAILDRSGARDPEAEIQAWVRLNHQSPGAAYDADRFAVWSRGRRQEHPEKFRKATPRTASNTTARPKPRAEKPAPTPTPNFKPQPGETAEDRRRMKVAMAKRLQELGVRTLPPQFAVSASELSPDRYRGDFQPRQSQPMSPDAQKALRQEQALRRAGVLGSGDVGVSKGSNTDTGSGLGK